MPELGNRGIVRGRMFLGALLLLAAVLTWSIGLMMSPHGETVAKGTDHVRATIVTFKHKGAVGTLILCALAGWLLFPARRPKWPLRDWGLIGVLALLAGSSLYTLATLPGVPAANSQAMADTSPDWNADATASDPNATNIPVEPPPNFNGPTVPPPMITTREEAKNRAKVADAERLEEVNAGSSNEVRLPASPSNSEDSATDEPDENQQ